MNGRLYTKGLSASHIKAKTAYGQVFFTEVLQDLKSQKLQIIMRWRQCYCQFWEEFGMAKCSLDLPELLNDTCKSLGLGM